MPSKLTTKQFIGKLNRKYNYIYDYSLLDYKNNKIKIIIICKIHGQFQKFPSEHLIGHGCPDCELIGDIKIFDSIELNKLLFINKSKVIHNFKYNYLKVNYINAYTKVIIICPKHGEFQQIPSSHLNKRGCPKCAGKFLSNEQIIEKFNIVHNNIYDYSLVNVINTRTKVGIICNAHGIFQQSPNSHLRGRGCPKCQLSHGEKCIENYLKNNNIKFISQYKIQECKNINPLPFDFYLPDYNLLIEYDGAQHYQPWRNDKESIKLKYVQNNDNIKNNYCKYNNLNLLRIKYTDFKKIERILEDYTKI